MLTLNKKRLALSFEHQYHNVVVPAYGKVKVIYLLCQYLNVTGLL